jgi:hypothetical protein
MTTFTPFADDTASATIGGLTAENGRDRIALYGQGEITRDKAGLAQARALLALLGDVVKVLADDTSLPQHAPPAKAVPTKAVRNPFG